MSLCLRLCMNEPGRTKALSNRTEIWQAGGRNLSLPSSPPSSPRRVHPAVRIMFGTLAQAPSHPRPTERRKTLTHFNAATGRKGAAQRKLKPGVPWSDEEKEAPRL